MNNALIKILLKLKNASSLNKESVVVNPTISCRPYLNFLYNEGFIQGFKFDSKNSCYTVQLRFFQQKCLITNIKIFSFPSYNHFISYFELNFINSKRKFFLFSTNKGLFTLSDCKKQKIGGKLLFCID